MDTALDARTIAAQRALRVEWAARSLDTAWAFPSDWGTPAVEALCEAIVLHGDVFPPAERLGRARADAGIGLGETLADIDQLAALVPGRYAEPMRRAVSLGWADGSSGPTGHVFDPDCDARPVPRGTHWTRPELVAQIGFAEWTGDGRLRQPRFLGLRDDKAPTDVVRERPS